MGKDYHSSFDSGRISFEPCEVSARSTSLGMSGSDSKLSDSSSRCISWNDMENGDMNEFFISDEEGMLKQLEKDEKSFVADYLPPINPDMIPDPNSSRLSAFSDVHDEEKIMVRPSWIGLEGGSDDPINISIGQYFRMKTEVLPSSSTGHLTPDQRPNFGMKITSPRRKEKGIPLVSDSFNESSRESTCESQQKLNVTQVITPKESPMPPRNEVDINESSPESISPTSVSIPSLSYIDKILQEIDSNDSPNTMANKFLGYSSPSNSQNLDNANEHLADNRAKNNIIEKNLDDNMHLKDLKKSGLQTPKILVTKSTGQGSGRGISYARSTSTRKNLDESKDVRSMKHEIPDLVKKLNSLERRGQKDKNALKNVSSLVDKLKSNVAGPLDCSALYETLNNDLVIEGPLDCETTVSFSETQRGALMAQECNGGKCWIEIPEEILIAGDENELQQQLCVGLGFSAFVPLVNLTNNWLMYQVSPLKDSNGEDIVFQQLPIKTLLAPGSNAEFEVIIAPRHAGKHSVSLKVEVTNFMAEGDAPNQTYCTKLTLHSSIPKVVLISDGMNELKDRETLNFGVLPEECSKILSLHLLNAGKSDIPVRIVIEEMPEAYQPFGICNASRLPISSDSILSNVDTDKLHQCGINFEKKDLLSCDLSGSGSNSMVTICLYFRPPRIGVNSLNVSNEVTRLSARLRVELDVPLNCVSEFTVLKEVILTGQFGVTKLEVGIGSDPLILNSKERNAQGAIGRGAVPKHKQNIFPPVTQRIPIGNQGAIPLHVTAYISQANDEKNKVDDEMTVIPDSIDLRPGERSSLSVSYQPGTKIDYECNRILVLKLNPNGPIFSYNLKGVCVPTKYRHSWVEEDVIQAVQPAETRLEQVPVSLDSAPQIIQATRTTLVWGSVPLNADYLKSSFHLRNPTAVLEKVSLAVTGSEDYKLLNHESEVVRKTSFDLAPKQSQVVRVFFRPKRLGPSVGKLEITIFDGREPSRKIASKMMSLYGHGGCSKIEVIALPKDMAGRPWLNLGLIFSHPLGTGALDFGTPLKVNTSRSASPSQSAPSLKSRLLIHNAGSLAAFVKIIPLALGVEPESLSNLEEGREHFVTVRPDVFQLEPLTGINVWVSYIHGLNGNASANDSARESCHKGERALEEVAKLLILSGEVVTRARLRKIYKTAEIIHVNKDIGQFLNLNGLSLSFIGVATNEGRVTELEEYPDGDEGEKQISALCDPATKYAVDSLMQNMKSTEVLLAVEKEIGAKQLDNDANATLVVQNGGNEVFHALMDDKDASPCPIRSTYFLNPENFASNSELCGNIWSIDPEGTVCLGAGHGTTATVTLRSHTSAIITFEIRLGLVEIDGSIKWFPPSYRQTQATSSLLVVDPCQGQLSPFGCAQLKIYLQKDSRAPLLNGIMQVYSENDSLKVKIKIKGKNSQIMQERLQENSIDKTIMNRAFVMNNATNGGLMNHDIGGEKAVVLRKESANSEVSLSQKLDERRRNSLYVDTSALTFPVTKVGSKSYQKLVLKNPTNEHYTVHIFPVAIPFVAPNETRTLRDHFYLAMKIGFCPQSPGSFEQTITIKVASLMSSRQMQSIAVTLTGKSVL
ncbi:uncharacterized protein spd-2 [Hetaerina americana]|uniref:uncharacterized protein spd-2 n=1 Tax=Hetaerina americana TaxID=62018 RepID=UPI003A7F3743